MRNETLLLPDVSLALVAVFLLSSSTPVLVGTEEQKPAAFSQNATAIWENFRRQGSYPEGAIVVPSPDGEKSVTAAFDRKTESVTLTVSNGRAHFVASIEGGVGSEIAWSPDSQAFSVTWSSEGLSGEFHTRVYYILASGLKRISLNQTINHAFGQPPTCEKSPWPTNVAAVTWLGNSRRLLVVAEIPPLSICDSFGTFKAFEILLPEATVVEQYDQPTAKRKFWSDLGWRLREAPDYCIADPKSCWSPANHPEIPRQPEELKQTVAHLQGGG